MRHVLAASRVVVLAVAGAIVGIASVAVHGLTPGLVLALVATAAAGYALPAGWTRRLPFGAGWCAVVLVAAVPRSTGSYLVANGPRGWVLIGGAFTLLLLSVVTAMPRPSRAAADAGSDSTVS